MMKLKKASARVLTLLLTLMILADGHGSCSGASGIQLS